MNALAKAKSSSNMVVRGMGAGHKDEYSVEIWQMTGVLCICLEVSNPPQKLYQHYNNSKHSKSNTTVH